MQKISSQANRAGRAAVDAYNLWLGKKEEVRRLEWQANNLLREMDELTSVMQFSLMALDAEEGLEEALKERVSSVQLPAIRELVAEMLERERGKADG